MRVLGAGGAVEPVRGEVAKNRKGKDRKSSQKEKVERIRVLRVHRRRVRVETGKRDTTSTLCNDLRHTLRSEIFIKRIFANRRDSVMNRIGVNGEDACQEYFAPP